MSWTIQADSGKSLRLLQPQEDRNVSDGGPNVFDIYGFDADEAILAALEHQEKLEMVGVATANRLSSFPSYSNDPQTALAEWAVKFQSFVNGKQGGGITLHNGDRGRTYLGVITRAGWQRNQGEAYQIMWDLTMLIGGGTMQSEDTTPPSVNPHGSPTFDGTDLHAIQSIREDKKQNAGIYSIALADPGGNQVLSKGGATRKIIVRGKVIGDRTTRNNFDRVMRAKVGKDHIGALDTGFPGRSIDCMLANFEGTREAGVTRTGEYSMEFIEGRAQGGL